MRAMHKQRARAPSKTAWRHSVASAGSIKSCQAPTLPRAVTALSVAAAALSDFAPGVVITAVRSCEACAEKVC